MADKADPLGRQVQSIVIRPVALMKALPIAPNHAQRLW
jgi:hypothetical protein